MASNILEWYYGIFYVCVLTFTYFYKGCRVDFIAVKYILNFFFKRNFTVSYTKKFHCDAATLMWSLDNKKYIPFRISCPKWYWTSNKFTKIFINKHQKQQQQRKKPNNKNENTKYLFDSKSVRNELIKTFCLARKFSTIYFLYSLFH